MYKFENRSKIYCFSLFVCSFVNKRELLMDFVNLCGRMLGPLTV